MKCASIVVDVGKHAIGEGAAFLRYQPQVTSVRCAQSHMVLREYSCLTLLGAREVNKHQPAHASYRLAYVMIALGLKTCSEKSASRSGVLAVCCQSSPLSPLQFFSN